MISDFLLRPSAAGLVVIYWGSSIVSLMVAIDAFVANHMFLLVKSTRSVCPRIPVVHHLFCAGKLANIWSIVFDVHENAHAVSFERHIETPCSRMVSPFLEYLPTSNPYSHRTSIYTFPNGKLQVRSSHHELHLHARAVSDGTWVSG
jgi:hypothetical protein